MIFKLIQYRQNRTELNSQYSRHNRNGRFTTFKQAPDDFGALALLKKHNIYKVTL